MITENLSTLKIHKLSQSQYEKAVESGNVESNALYLTPTDDDIKKHNSSTTAHEDIRKVVSDNTKRVNNLEKDLNIDKQKIEENKSQFDIKSVEGVNPVINNGANTYFYGMNIYGKTEQRTTTGKQLLENTATNITKNQMSMTVDSEKRCIFNGTTSEETWFEIGLPPLKANESYILSGCPSGGSANAYYIVLEGYTGLTQEFGNGKTFTSPIDNTEKMVRIVFAKGVTANNLVFKPMIRLASITDPTYEPYTGEKASPNAEFPQDLESKGKWGNLAHFADTDAFTHAGVTWSCKNGAITAKGTVNTSYPSTTGDGSRLICDITGKKGTFFASGSKDNVLITVIKTNASGTTYYTDKSFTLDGTETKVYIYCEVAKGNTVDTTIYPMLNEGTTALPYRPYSGQMEIESAVLGGNLLDNDVSNLTQSNGTITYDSATDEYVFNATGRDVYLGEVQGESGGYIKSKGNLVSIHKNKYYLQLSNPLFTKNYVTFYDENLNSLGFKTGIGYNSVIDVLDGAKYMSFRFGYENSVSGTTYRTKIMVSEENIDFEPYKPKQSHISLVGDGLKGIPVTDSSLATYTDENGQMWCSDYVDLERGVLVQRILRDVTDETTVVSEYTSHVISGWKKYKIKTKTDTKIYHNKDNAALGYCNAFSVITISGYITQWDNKAVGIAWSKTSGEYYVMVTEEMFPTVEDFTEYVKNNPIEIMGVLATPIETPLSTSEIASYKALHSNHGVTTVMNNCDAYMKIGYLDQKYDDGVIDVVEKTVENAIGDISVALDELHAYAEALLGGAS